MATAELSSSHQILFATTEPISAIQLAESLLGLDGMIKLSASVLSRLVPDGPRIRAEVLVTSIEEGSYKENIVVRLLFGKGRQQEQNIEKFRAALGLKSMDTKKIIGLVITGAILWGAYQYLKPSDPGKIVIQNSFNVIGQDLNMTGDEVVSLFETALGHKREEFKRDVVKMASPVNQKTPGKIVVDENPKLTIAPEVIERIPKQYEKAEPAESFKDFTNEQMIIRALDLDSSAKGWAVCVPSLTEARLPLEIADGIKSQLIPPGKYVYGDFTVLFKEDSHGTKVPHRVLLRKVRLDEHDPAGTSL